MNVILKVVEISILVYTLWLAYQWMGSPNGSFEPTIVFWGIVLSILEVFRRMKIAPRELPPLPLDVDLAKQLGMEQALEREGYRLFIGYLPDLEKNLYFGDYELIVWPDKSGRKCVVAPSEDCDYILLKTKYDSDEIERRRASRERSND